MSHITDRRGVMGFFVWFFLSFSFAFFFFFFFWGGGGGGLVAWFRFFGGFIVCFVLFVYLFGLVWFSNKLVH